MFPRIRLPFPFDLLYGVWRVVGWNHTSYHPALVNQDWLMFRRLPRTCQKKLSCCYCFYSCLHRQYTVMNFVGVPLRPSNLWNNCHQ
uniref:Putative secreted protein n=1 Tax=Anopheles marajoara TaxID=58244 RepID=A0A2M4CAJ0_9DIPT